MLDFCLRAFGTDALYKKAWGFLNDFLKESCDYIHAPH